MQDKTDYALHVALQDKAGNSATGVTLAVLSRLSASIDIDKVVANNLEASGQDGTVLNFDTEDMSVTPDSYINAKEKSVGSLDTGDTSSMGFTVHGTSNIGAGQIVTVQLWQPDKSIAPVLGSGTVDDKGEWSVYFSSGSVGNLTDGQWQLKATGEDKDGNQAAQNEHSVVAFTVDTLASVGLNPIGGDAHRINLTQDGSTLTVSGTFSNIDAGNTLTLALRDKNAANPTQVIQTWTLAPADLVLHTEGAITTWTYHIPLATLDALHFAHPAGASQADVAKLSLTASSLDLAGNPAADSVIFELDRTPPAAPGAGVAIRQVAGSTLEAGSTTSLNSATTLHDPNQGVLIAPHAEAPTAGDIASITVEGTQVFAATDKWRLGTHVWRMDTTVSDTSVALGSGAASFGVTYSYVKDLARLVIKANGSSFTSAQVQTVMSGLAWVNTSADNELDQLDRQFTVSYTDGGRCCHQVV